MSEQRKYEPADPDMVEDQFNDMPDPEFQEIGARYNKVAAKRQAAKNPADDASRMTRQDVIKKYGFDPGWR
jgi:hypothetical protein